MVQNGNSPRVYVSCQGSQYGPIDVDELKIWIQENRVNSGTMCWYEGLIEWVPLVQVFPHLFQPPSTLNALSPPPAPPPPPVPSVTRKKKKGKLTLILTIFFVLVLGLGAVGYFMFADLITGNPDIQSMSLECRTPVQFVEGKDSHIASIDYWEMELPNIEKGTEGSLFEWKNRRLMVSYTRKDDFSGALITDTIEIQMGKKWEDIESCKWHHSEKTDDFTDVSELTGVNLSKKTEDSSENSNVYVFQAVGQERAGDIGLTETMTWPNYPDFDQHIESLLWDEESQFTVRIVKAGRGGTK